MRRYELTFALELHRAECEFLTGEIEPAERRLAALAQHTTSVVDAASVAGLQVNLYTTSDRPQRAVTSALEYLRRVGIEWSAHPSKSEIREEFTQMWQRLGDRSINELVDLPKMAEPTWRATVDVLMLVTAAASLPTKTCAVSPSFARSTWGFSMAIPTARPRLTFSSARSLGSEFGDHESAFRFGKLGFDLMEKRGPLRFRALVYMSFAIMVNHWSRHLRSSIEFEERAFEAAEQSGNVQVASYAQNDITTLLLACGNPLDDVESRLEEGLAYVRRAKYGLVVDCLISKLRFVRMLRGLTSSIASFDGDGFDEREFERHLESAPSLAIAAGWYWIRKLQGRFLALDYRGALEAAAKAETLLWTTRCHPEVAEFTLYAGLAQAASYDGAPPTRRDEHLNALVRHLRQMQIWAQNPPENFAFGAALMGAEQARIEGDHDRAARLYEEAVLSARQNGFVQNEALAYEAAARFYRGRGFPLIADTYLSESRVCYVRWGAQGKVRDLERRQPQLR